MKKRHVPGGNGRISTLRGLRANAFGLLVGRLGSHEHRLEQPPGEPELANDVHEGQGDQRVADFAAIFEQGVPLVELCRDGCEVGNPSGIRENETDHAPHSLIGAAVSGLPSSPERQGGRQQDEDEGAEDGKPDGHYVPPQGGY